VVRSVDSVVRKGGQAGDADLSPLSDRRNQRKLTWKVLESHLRATARAITSEQSRQDPEQVSPRHNPHQRISGLIDDG
jgi:hypothetical protein